MMCYKDQTFCSFKECLAFIECSRALTEGVQKRAQVWWGGDDPPIAVYAEKPDCFVFKKVPE